MKKATTLIILLALLFSLNIPINAEESKTSCIKDTQLREKLTNSISKEELDILGNKDIWFDLDNLDEDIDITNKPILKVFKENIWWVAHLPLDEITNIFSEKAKTQMKTVDYVVFDEKPMRFSVGDNIKTDDTDDYVVTPSYELPGAPFISDVMNLSCTTEILNISCEIENLIVFDSFSSHLGAMLYASTNKGIFVKYYADQASEGAWFAEEDFQKYAKAYYEYTTSYEYNYNEKGEPLAIGSTSLLDFIETKYEGENIVSNDGKNFSYLWIAIPVGVVGLLSIVAVVIFRKKRLNKNFKYL